MTEPPSNPLAIDPTSEIDTITGTVGHAVRKTLRKQGAVVAVSGGIDSAVCAGLCVRALGSKSVLGLFLPDRHSSLESAGLAKELGGCLGMELIVDSIDPILDAAGCYRSQTESLKSVFPEYTEGDQFKIVLPSLLASDRLALPRVTLRTAGGEDVTKRLPSAPYLQLVAATNFKQRTRTMLAYYHADRLNYAVCGTPNRLEFDQGFFVKGGDGLSDFTPIAHLYKSQVYALGRALGLPAGILDRPPTTDTFPLEQTQEEFYFSVPYRIMDLCLHGLNSGLTAAKVAGMTELTVEQVERIFRDIEAKRRATISLHLPPLRFGEMHPVDEHVASIIAGRSS